MAPTRGAALRAARGCAAYARSAAWTARWTAAASDASWFGSAHPRSAAFALCRRFAATASDDDIGPVTLDFAKLIVPGERPLAAYERLSAQGVLRRDDAQLAAIRVLDRLHAKLIAGDEGSASAAPAPPKPRREGGWFADLFTARDDTPPPSRAGHGGVYIHGGPGCGKTFVMDLAYACLPGTPGVHKRREHFHSFMLATHHALHKLGKTGTTRDTVALYAADVAKDAAVLCLDEFQVTDVADAMIIRRLLDELWARGVTLVTTSNRAPDELYKNGLNRAQFVPCIEAIKARCELHEMASERDYRLTGHALASRVATNATSNASSEKISDADASETPFESSDGIFSGVTWRVAREDDPTETAAAEEWLDRRLGALAKNDRMVRVEVAMGGRRILVERAGGGVARLDFDEVCGSALGAGDYTAIASVFHTVGLARVPRMTVDRADLMRRFITFVDVLYEHKVKLLATAATTPAELLDRSGGGAGSQRDEEFAWDRAASRLAEMSTAEYVEAPWRPKSGAWLLEQARVTEVVPERVLRALWQRYDADHNGVLDESELEELLADLNEMRRGHRNVPKEQLEAAWAELTNRGRRGGGAAAGAPLGVVDGETCEIEGGPKQRAMPSRRGDAFIAFEDFIAYGNSAFAACMLARDEGGAKNATRA